MEEIKNFIAKYKGAIIGIIVGILILITRLSDLILGIVVIAIGAFVGNYIQQNKEDVKAKLKKFIDRM
jgi:uncharacterized protein YqgC (DUF456 family)